MGKVITLGEILIRYSTEKGQHLEDSSRLFFHYGGSEANVSIGLSGLSHDVSLLSVVPNNPLGNGSLQHFRKYGVNTSRVYYSGDRLGAYFVEVGAGPRATSVVYDRKHSSLAELTQTMWEDDSLFDDVDLFHVSGITTALSDELVDITLALMKKAKEKGIKVSFDSNYRAKLWSLETASEVYKSLLPYVDIFSAGKLDAINLLGVTPIDVSSPVEELTYYSQEMQKLYPNISVIYSTTREVISTDENYLQGNLWVDNTLYQSRQFHIPYIVDRIGGGDAFSAGMLHGLLTKDSAQHSIEFATGMSVLKHTYAGDSLYVSNDVVETFIQSDSSKINR